MAHNKMAGCCGCAFVVFEGCFVCVALLDSVAGGGDPMFVHHEQVAELEGYSHHPGGGGGVARCLCMCRVGVWQWRAMCAPCGWLCVPICFCLLSGRAAINNREWRFVYSVNYNPVFVLVVFRPHKILRFFVAVETYVCVLRTGTTCAFDATAHVYFRSSRLRNVLDPSLTVPNCVSQVYCCLMLSLFFTCMHTGTVLFSK